MRVSPTVQYTPSDHMHVRSHAALDTPRGPQFAGSKRIRCKVMPKLEDLHLRSQRVRGALPNAPCSSPLDPAPLSLAPVTPSLKLCMHSTPISDWMKAVPPRQLLPQAGPLQVVPSPGNVLVPLWVGRARPSGERPALPCRPRRWAALGCHLLQPLSPRPPKTKEPRTQRPRGPVRARRGNAGPRRQRPSP